MLAEKAYKSFAPPREEWFYDSDLNKVDQGAYFAAVMLFAIDMADGIPNGTSPRKSKRTSTGKSPR